MARFNAPRPEWSYPLAQGLLGAAAVLLLGGLDWLPLLLAAALHTGRDE